MGLVLRAKHFLAPLLFLLLITLAVPLGSGVADAEVHDVAVTQVDAWPALTLPSYVYVNVTVENQGTSYETFDVTVHADNLTVTSAIVDDLAPGSNRTLTIRCDLFPFRADIFQLELPERHSRGTMFANVMMWAEASVVAGEIDTADNVYTDGTVNIIWRASDLNGDGTIDIVDIAIIATSFGQDYGFHPLWDFNRDGIFDIVDIVYVALDFGLVYFEPPSPDSGILQVFAWYATPSDTGGWIGSYVAVDVSVSGPQSTSGTTKTSGPPLIPSDFVFDALTFSLTSGAYTVSGTYNGVVESVNATVEQEKLAIAFLNFGGPLPP